MARRDRPPQGRPKIGPKIWIDGRPVDAARARVPVLDRGFLYGDSVYEVLRTFGGHPFELGAHLDRLERSAAGLAMALPPRAEIEAAVAETCRAVAPQKRPDLYIRIIVTRGAGPIGLDPTLGDRPRLVVIVRPVELPPPELYQTGVTVALVQRSRSGPGAIDPTIKSGNYLSSVLAVGQAKERGAYEALFIDALGRVAEGGSSNLFAVIAGRLVTPPVSVGILEGITRNTVLELARRNGLEVDERPLWPEELKGAEEALLTSSVRGLLPIVRVDERSLGDGRPGPVTRRLMALYDQLTQTPPR